jgi:hypothetical protein
MSNSDTQLIPLGVVLLTPGASDLMKELGLDSVHLLARHCTGDWGDLEEADKQANAAALLEGSRIFSAYKLADDHKVWIITEADRRSTTILLPSEY